uniref:Uncharacterized protein n=1 Tax=Tanacetum cinerariifolium TaxID=118510 RepID=A0A6L2J3E2_TANCI|nr:hypothetical protein [Tanacetum cinerariifolium]
MLKGTYFKAKTNTFEDYLFLTNTPYPGKEIRRISAKSSQENRIETTNQETKFHATVYGKTQTISESSLRRHLKLNDEEGISSLPDAKLFENLSLMGYNILPNQSNISTAVVCLATNRVYNFIKMILMGEGSANPTEPHHTPSPQKQHLSHHDSPPLSHPTTSSEPIPQAPTKPLTHRQYTKRAKRIAQSKALSPAVDEPASLSRYDRQGEAFPTVSSLDARQDRENITKTSALPQESSPRVTSLDADEGNKERRSVEPTQEDAPITEEIMEIGEELGEDKSIELGRNDTKEMVNVLTSMEATNILISKGAAASVSSADVLPAAGVPTVSGSFPTVSAIFTTASVVAPYTIQPRGIIIGSSQHMRSPIIGAKDKGKEKVIETEVPKKRKLQEQIDAHVAREMEEEFARENQRLSEELARDSKIARLHAEEELKIMIEGLDRSIKVIAKHLREYEQAEADLSVGEKIELINEMVKYQDHHAKILKMRTSKSVSEDVSEEEHKGMMQLVPLEEVYVRALQLYDTCGVHHVSTKDQEIFMLVEKDYPLRKGLATVMISNKLQGEQFSQMASDLILKIHNIANNPMIEASSLGEFVRSYLVQVSLAYKRSP